MVMKIVLSIILPTCFKTENKCFEPKDEVCKQTSSKRLSISDLSSSTSSFSLLTDLSNSLIKSNIHIFTLAELQLITHNFCCSNYLGQGGFGPVYKGVVDDKLRPGLEAQPVAVKVLDLDGRQGHKEWLAEVIFLGQLRHPHLVKLIGYCCEDEHRLLVYEYMPRGNLESHLFARYSVPLPWLTRLKIAVGAAKGLAFLHGEEPPVIYRDFKASNILLDSDYTAKLSDFGLALDGPEGDNTHVTTRIMGTEGYAAPEYIMTGHVTTKCDVFCFGVVLLELLTGRRAIDTSRPRREKNLVDWAKPLLKDTHQLDKIMDPKLQGQFSKEGANKAAKLAYHCLSHHSKSRPTMVDVVLTLEPLLDFNDFPTDSFVYTVPIQGKKNSNDVQVELVSMHDEKDQAKKDCLEKGIKRRNNNGHRHKRRRSYKARAVYSDTALYTTFRKSNSLPTHREH